MDYEERTGQTRRITIAILLTTVCFQKITCDLMQDLKHIDALVSDSSRYDARIPPEDEGTIVMVKLWIRDLWDINQQDMDCSVDLLLTQAWKDWRIYFNSSMDNAIVLTDNAILEKIWKPEIYFPNVKVANLHTVPFKNQILVLFNSGVIFYTLRLTLKFSCQLYLQDFPFDEQECSLQLSSITGNRNKLIWVEDDPIEALRIIKLPHYNITGTETTFCDDFKALDNDSTCLEATIYFKRLIGFHIVNTYIPSFLLVVVSWASFWMQPSAAPARISLGVTTLLTISTQGSALRSQTGKVSYVKAVDVWMMVCSALIFLALCEFIVANYIDSQAKKQSPEDKDPESVKEEENVSALRRCRRKSIDEVARIIFPLSFFIFNIAYWIYYTS